MASYAIMRIEKRKLGSVSRICNHHERLKEQYKSNPDIDPERTHLNYHLKKPDDRYRPLVLNRIEEAGARRRKDSVVLQDCIVTASPDWINDKPYEEQVRFFNHAYDYFQNKFREENLISAVVHMDEANPHMHLCFVPITEDNRLSSKEIIGGPKGLSKLQDEFYEHMAKEYPDLNRGISSMITHRKHVPTEFYKNADMLFGHYEEIVSAINNIGLVNNAKKKDDALALLGRYAPEMAQLKSQLKATDNHINSLEEGLKKMDRIVDKKNDTIHDQRQEISELKDKLLELNYKQQQLLKVIDRIPTEVLEQMKKDEKQRRKDSREER